VVAIFFGDELRGTPAADSEDTTTGDQVTSTAPTLPSLDDSTSTPTDTAVPPTDTAAPTTATPTATAAGGDPLGLGVPMSAPACDGTWVVIVGSATDPASYADGVSALLSANTQAKYVLTQGACASLRQQSPEGNQIYAVYLGPYPDQASACTVSTSTGNGAYVKRMDDTTPPEQTWEC
jgi:serine/threonine-protein kinase